MHALRRFCRANSSLIFILLQLSSGFESVSRCGRPRPMKGGGSGNRVAPEVPVYGSGQEVIKGLELVLWVLIAHLFSVVVVVSAW